MIFKGTFGCRGEFEPRLRLNERHMASNFPEAKDYEAFLDGVKVPRCIVAMESGDDGVGYVVTLPENPLRCPVHPQGKGKFCDGLLFEFIEGNVNLIKKGGHDGA